MPLDEAWREKKKKKKEKRREKKRPQLTCTADDNRARFVESGRIHAIIELLDDDSLLAFVIPVLYNVLVDYGKDDATPQSLATYAS